MTSDRRFEQDLPDLLAELAPRAKPDYRDDIVRQTAHMRQRPAWMFPERWLPMTSITTRAVAAPPIRWRILGVVALLLLALLVGLATLAGSQRRVPPPFGPAANGRVAYEANGDIFTADPVTGAVTAVVTGAHTDAGPVWSRDGTLLAFKRTDAGSQFSRLFVARSDGSGLVGVTPEPIADLSSYTFSPDGTEIALMSANEASPKLWIAKADGSGLRQVDVPVTVVEVSYRPPNGAELIVTGSKPGSTNGIYGYDLRSGALRTIVEPSPGIGVDYVRASPDGSRIAYSASADVPVEPTVGNSYRVHVVGIDGQNDRTLPMPARATFQDAPAWSNDGTRLVVTRGYGLHNEDMALAVLPADGSGAGVESAHGLTGCCDTIIEWSPDDTSILVTPENLDGAFTQQLLLDPSSGRTTPAPWTATTPPAWQRVAR
jgi:dipeptidyl aminopeptidase/acylaminoacyl peptidase